MKNFKHLTLCASLLLLATVISSPAFGQAPDLASQGSANVSVDFVPGSPPGNVWDNGGFDSINGVTSERDTIVSGTGGPEGDHGSTVADDFEITLLPTTIEEVRVCLLVEGDVTEAEMYIYMDDSGQPGPAVNAPLFGAPTTASITSTTYEDDTERCPDAFGAIGRQFHFSPATTGQAFPTLDPGRYWLAVVGDGNGDDELGRAFWATSSPTTRLNRSLVGSTYYEIPYWSDISEAVPGVRDFAFDIDGSVVPFTARFAVVKFFLDQNPADVTVNLECNTGTDRVQSAEISGLLGGDNLVVFVNEEMLPDADGDLFWCEVTETNQPNGYVPLYIPFEVDNATTEDFQAIAEAHHGDYPTSCRYEGAIGPDGPPPPPDVEDLIANVDHIGPIQELNVCLIINVPHPVEVDVSKVWDITGAGDGGDNYSKETTIRVKSDWILDGGKCHQHGGGYGAEEDGYKSDCVFLDFSGDQTKSVWVWPFYNPGDDDVDDGIPVYFREMGMDSAYEVTSTCGNGNEGMIRVRVGDSSAGCTFTNTLFFEGIPTLNQYGLALLALLMLGMGAVAFRRIA